MTVPFRFNVVSKETRLPMAGLVGDFDVFAWQWDGAGYAPVAAPVVTDGGAGNYDVNADEAMVEATGVVLIRTTQEPFWWLVPIFKTDNSNQILAALFVEVSMTDETLVPVGALPTGTSSWSSSPTPDVFDVDDGVVVLRPSVADIENGATGTMNAGGAYEPVQFQFVVDAVGGGSGGGGLGGGAIRRTSFVRRVLRTRG